MGARARSGDGAQGQLGLIWRADLANKYQVQRCSQCFGRFKTNWQAASGKGEHNRPLVLENKQLIGKTTAGLVSIQELPAV